MPTTSRVVLAQAQGSKAMSKARGQRHAPACPGVPQRRARSARSGPDGACDGATCERDSLFLFSLIILFSDATRCNAASEKHFVDRLVLSKHVHTRFISCSRGGPLTCTALTVQNSQKGQLGCSWSTSIPDANGCPAGYQNFFRKNRNILELKSATSKFSNEKPIVLT